MSRDHDTSTRKRSRRRCTTREKKMQVAMANGYDARSVMTYNDDEQQHHHHHHYQRGWYSRVAQKLGQWSFLYNVTTGLYMLDMWERCLFNAIFVVFLLVAGYNSGHFISKFGAGVAAWCGDNSWFDSVGSQHLRTALGALGFG